MIASFRHRALEVLYKGKPARWVAPRHVEKLRDILAALDLSRGAEGMDLPGLHLHKLTGPPDHPWKDIMRFRCRATGRVTFRLEDNSALDVDYVDDY